MISICSKTTTNNIVSVSENKRKFTIKNNSKFIINEVKVDGCYINSGLKCDFLFELGKKSIEKVFYVELKGSDITHGIQQIEATIKFCNKIHKQIKKECYIVASKVPSSGTSSQVLKKQFIKKNKIQLFIDTNIRQVAV